MVYSKEVAVLKSIEIGIQKNLNCLLERITRAINIAYKNKKTL